MPGQQNSGLTLLTAGDERPDITKLLPTVYLLSGAVNSGKTTALRRWIEEWRSEGVAVRGILSEAVLEGTRKIGYDLIDLQTGVAHPLIRRQRFAKGWQVGEYYFDSDGFAALTESIQRQGQNDVPPREKPETQERHGIAEATSRDWRDGGRSAPQEGCHAPRSDETAYLLVLDEIGPLELHNKKGLYALLMHFLQHDASVLLVVRDSEVERISSLIQSIRRGKSRGYER